MFKDKLIELGFQHGHSLVDSWNAGLRLAAKTRHRPLIGLAHGPEAALEAWPRPGPEAEGGHNPEGAKCRKISLLAYNQFSFLVQAFTNSTMTTVDS